MKENISKELIVDHHSFDMFKIEKFDYYLLEFFSSYNIDKYDIIAISLYCWCIDYVKRIISELKKLNSVCKIYLGGNEVHNVKSYELKNEFPECEGFLIGEGEESLRRIILGEQSSGYIENQVDLKNVPMIYSNQYILINDNIKSIRIATKRGCIYKCSYCAHRDLIHNSIREYELTSVIKEFEFINQQNINKVNVIDPIFNCGENYLFILNKLVNMKFKPKISLQVRADLISGFDGDKFLELVSQLDCILEFGIQSIDPKVLNEINRETNIKQIKKVIRSLNEMGIQYIVSFIYGLPYQNIKSIKNTIKFCKYNHIKSFEFNRLMLLRGTKLFEQKEVFQYKEETINGISYVKSSKFFSESNFNKIKSLVSKFEKTYKV